MKRNLLIVGLVLAAAAVGAAEYLSQFGSNGPSTILQWPGQAGKQLRMVAVDATSDSATSYLTWRTAKAQPPATVVDAAAEDTTNVWVGAASGFAENDVVLIQAAAGTVLNRTVHALVEQTNHVITITQPVATNIAADVPFGVVVGSAATLLQPAADDATIYHVSGGANLQKGDLIGAQVAPDQILMGAIGELTNATSYQVRLREPAGGGLVLGDDVYVKWSSTARTFLSQPTGDETSWHVSSTNGFLLDGYALVETASGQVGVAAIASSSDTTNLVVSDALSFTPTNGDLIFPLLNASKVTQPTAEGSFYIYLSSSNGVIAGATLVSATAGAPVWQAHAYGMASQGSYKTIELTATFGAALGVGTRILEVTNVSTITRGASAGDTEVYVPLKGTNGVIAGAQLVIGKDATGTNGFLTTVRAKAPVTVNKLQLKAVTGATLSAGDRIWESQVANSLVGAATVRLQGAALMSAPIGTPAELSLDGTALSRVWATGVWE